MGQLTKTLTDLKMVYQATQRTQEDKERAMQGN